MKPGPSSVRLFSKCAQSTMSRASSLTCYSSNAECHRRGPTCRSDKRKRVNFSLAPAPIERIPASAEVEPQRHWAKLEIAAHGIEQIAPIALGQLFGAVAEHDECRRTRLHLGDVAELDPLTARRRRRIGLDRSLEPAIELARWHAPGPGVAEVEADVQNRI